MHAVLYMWGQKKHPVLYIDLDVLVNPWILAAHDLSALDWLNYTVYTVHFPILLSHYFSIVSLFYCVLLLSIIAISSNLTHKRLKHHMITWFYECYSSIPAKTVHLNWDVLCYYSTFRQLSTFTFSQVDVGRCHWTLGDNKNDTSCAAAKQERREASIKHSLYPPRHSWEEYN